MGVEANKARINSDRSAHARDGYDDFPSPDASQSLTYDFQTQQDETTIEKRHDVKSKWIPMALTAEKAS